MKFRRRSPPQLLLLLLLPSLTLAVANPAPVAKSDLKSTEESSYDDDDAEPAGPLPAPIVPNDPKIRPDVGTKDAPVDGLDGKPHAGPWVEGGIDKDKKEKKKPSTDPADEEGEGSVPLEKPKAIKPGPRLGTDAAIPEVNDGVMDDPHRPAPKKGTTGTEGGVSEKARVQKAQEGQTGEKSEKKPDPPKEAPPLPESEEKNLKGTGKGKGKGKDGASEADPDSESESGKGKGKGKGKSSKPVDSDTEAKKKEKGGIGGLEKPTDLPEKTHGNPLPVPPKVDAPQAGTGTAPGKTAAVPTKAKLTPVEEETLIQPLHSFALSLTMIIFSEIGDKTFLIAALMAMKHPRLLVFSAAFSALIAMTVLSAVLGHAVPTLIPKRFTNFLAAALFLVFGARMLREGYGISPDEGVSEEMKEVEMELEEKEHLARTEKGRRKSSISLYTLEAGRGSSRKSRSESRLPVPPRSPSSSRSRSPSPVSSLTSATTALAGLNNLFSLLLSPAWVQTFIMTFLGEWGDRSQIATIAMAAGQDYWWVTGGAVFGHGLCTAAAVIGGRAIAGRVSLRVVTLGGGFAFLTFGIIYLIEAVYYG